MARTKAADYDDKRNLIMDQAAALFARDGFAGASLSNLADACQVSKSLIYHYYPSKEAILYDVMSGHMEELLGVVEQARAKGLQGADGFSVFTRDLLSHYTGAADKQKVLLYELNSLPEPQREEIVAKQRELIDFVEGLLKQASPRAAKDKAQLRAKVMLFFGMLNWTHTWFRPKGPVSRDDVADMAAEIILGSL